MIPASQTYTNKNEEDDGEKKNCQESETYH